MTPILLLRQLELSDRRTCYALATVVEVFGSSSAKPGAKALIDAQGQVQTGWVGGGCAQAQVVQAALQSLRSGKPEVVDVDLNDEFFGAGMPCGGHMRVFVEPFLPKPRLWLTGSGSIVQALATFGSALDLDLVVIDGNMPAGNFPDEAHIIDDDPRYSQLKPDNHDFVVIANHHKGDYDALHQALASGAGYVALVASQHRAALIKQRLLQEGIEQTQLARVRTPAGLGLGGITPTEIALAIVSEIVMLHRGGHGRPLSDMPGE